MLFFTDTPVSGVSKKPKSLPLENVLRSQVAVPRDAFGSPEAVVAVKVMDGDAVAVSVTVDVEAVVGEEAGGVAVERAAVWMTAANVAVGLTGEG